MADELGPVLNQGKYAIVTCCILRITVGCGALVSLYIPYSRESPPTPQRAPTPHFWLNFLYRVKVYSNERPPLRYSLVPRVTGD